MMKEKLEKLLEMLKSDEESVDELFRECIKPCPADISGFSPVGGYRPEDTPYALYLLLWLVNPQDAISFKDMYKSRILSFMSVDERFMVSVEFYKYEVGLYFYAQKDLIDFAESSSFRGGWPDADNGEKFKNPDDALFFEVVKKVLEYEHCVYGGNNFFV